MLKALYCGLAVAASVLIVSNSPAEELLIDGGFEAGPMGGTWIESSTNFGSPICDVATCGDGGGTGARGGTFWAWFGGVGAFENGSTTQQSMTFPTSGTATLSFWYEKPVVSNDAADFLEVMIDNTVVWQDDGGSGDFVGYRQEIVDISGFVDGATHTLTFNSEIFGAGGVGTNFFVDDVSIDAVVPEPAALMLCVGLFGGLWGLRRRRCLVPA